MRCAAISFSHSSLSWGCDANGLQLCLECAIMNIVFPLIQIFSCVHWGLCRGWPLHEEGNVFAVPSSNTAQQSWTVEWTRQVWSWTVIPMYIRMYTSSVNTEHYILYTCIHNLVIYTTWVNGCFAIVSNHALAHMARPRLSNSYNMAMRALADLSPKGAKHPRAINQPSTWRAML